MADRPLSFRTPRGARDCRKDRGACRAVRRRRSRSNARQEELDVRAEYGDSDATEGIVDVKGSAKRRNETTSQHNTRIDASKTCERSQSRPRSRTSHTRTRSFGSSDQDSDHADRRKNNAVFIREVGAAKTKLQAAVGKHVRSTSSGDAALSDKVFEDQQGQCKCDRPTPGNSEPSCRLCARRKSRSLSPICSGCVTIASPSVAVVETQLTSAAVDEPKSGQLCRVLPKHGAELPPAESPEPSRTHDAKLSAAIGEIMRPIAPPRSSRRLRSTAGRGADVVADRIQDDAARVAQDMETASPSMPTLHADQQTAPASRAPGGVRNDVVQNADEDKDNVELSLRFVRKHDSVVAMSSTAASNASSRRTSVEKTHGDLDDTLHVGLGTLENDATLSGHNSLFDNSGTANDAVSKTTI